MSAVHRRPSSIDGLRRGAAAAPVTAPPATEITHAVGDSPVPPRRPRPEKPVTTRFTLDLDRGRHQALKNYAVSIEARGAAEVIRALLDELRDDPQLAARVRDRIWQGR